MGSGHLPPDAIVDILSRLRLKTLVRLRCVSKEWRDLISGLHFQLRRENPHFLYLDSYLKGKDPMCDISLVVPGSGRIRSNFTVQTAEQIKWPNLPYSYCGLLCLLIGNELCVCNPTTHQWVKIPPSPHIGHAFGGNIGIGSLPHLNQHKIVRLIGNDDNCSTSVRCEVFTLEGGASVESGSWRLTENAPPISVPPKTKADGGGGGGVGVNGVMHWLIHDLSRKTEKILYMGLKDEKFGFVGCPKEHYSSSYLTELKGFLCLVRISDDSLIIWKMVDHLNNVWRGEYKYSVRGKLSKELIFVHGHIGSDDENENENGNLLVSSPGGEHYALSPCGWTWTMGWTWKRARKTRKLSPPPQNPHIMRKFLFVHYDTLFFPGSP